MQATIAADEAFFLILRSVLVTINDVVAVAAEPIVGMPAFRPGSLSTHRPPTDPPWPLSKCRVAAVRELLGMACPVVVVGIRLVA